jgi:squalene-associated FAD-dependent desaturase
MSGARDADRPTHADPVIVVGAGWSGLAAAVALTRAALPVALLDAAPQAGGRARRLDLELAGRSVALDNGQHLMVGAYRDTLALARSVGASERALQRLPMRLRSTDGLALDSPRLPAPLHLAAGLLRARGFMPGDRLRLLRLLLVARARGWRPPRGIATVGAWLTAGRQPALLQRRFWEPLCVAMLNTDPQLACAATFLRVLRDTLGGSRAAADFLLPTATLDEVLPAPALAFLRKAGAEIALRETVTRIAPTAEGIWRVHTSRGERRARGVVLALPAPAQARLLRTLPDEPSAGRIAERLDSFRHEAIATAYLAWPAEVGARLPDMLMLAEESARQAWGQWLFGRGVQQGLAIGAVVVSAHGRVAADSGSLAAAIGHQLEQQVGLPPPLAARVITEKRATILCTPGRPRVGAGDVDGIALPWAGLWLAGDHAWPDYPSTLESAVRGGLAAAAAASGSLRAATPHQAQSDGAMASRG